VHRTLFRVVLGAVGLVALAAGAGTVLFSSAIIPGVGEAEPSLDSELRFYAAWYAVAGGAVLLRLPRIETATTLVRLVACAFFVGGCARVISLFVVGRPHPFFVALMIIELVLPVVLIPWQLAITRTTSTLDA
jgi:hypothetical protein